MPNKFLPVCLLALCLTALVAAQQPETPKPPAEAVAPKAEDRMPEFDLGEYQFGILRRGKQSGPVTEANKEAVAKLQAGHMANIQQMAAAGKLVAAGPMGDDGDIRGIFVCKAGSLAAAQALAANDPMIQAERLKLDWHVWRAPKGIGEKMLVEYKTNPAMKMTMTKYYLTLLVADPKADQAAAQKLLLPHLWHIRRMLDAKTFVAAGPFDGSGEIRGLFIIAAANLEEAQAIAQRDPMVKAGLLSAQIHPWWVAKEVWQ